MIDENDTARLILVRHALPEIDGAVPANQWRLSADGHARSVELAERLRAFDPRAAIASPEPKARDTAKAIASTLGLELSLDGRLREHQRTSVPFLSTADFQRCVRNVIECPDERVFGDETGREAAERFEAAIEQTVLNVGQNVVVVAHGTVIALFCQQVCGVKGADLWESLQMPDAVLLGWTDAAECQREWRFIGRLDDLMPS